MSFDVIDLPSLSLEPRCTPSQEYRPPVSPPSSFLLPTIFSPYSFIHRFSQDTEHFLEHEGCLLTDMQVKSTKRKPIKRNFATARAERGHIRTHHAEVSTPNKTTSKSIPLTEVHPRLTSTPSTAAQPPQAGQTTSSAVLQTPNSPRNPNTQSRRVSIAPTWRTRPNTPPPTVAQAHARSTTINPRATATPVPGPPIASVQPSSEKKTTPVTAMANTTRGKGKSFVPPRPVGAMPITSHLPTPDKSPSVNQVQGGSNVAPRKGRTGPRQKVKSLFLGMDPKTKKKPAPTPKSRPKQTHSQLQLESGSKSQEKKVTGEKGRQAYKNRKEVDLDEAEDGEWDEHGMWKPAPASERATRPAETVLNIDELAEDDKGEEEEKSEAVETLHQNVTKWLSDVESDVAELQSGQSGPDAQAGERTRRRLTLPTRRKNAIEAISLSNERMPISPLPTPGGNHTDRHSPLGQPAPSRRLDSNNLTAQPRSPSPSVDHHDLVTNQHLGSFRQSPIPSLHNDAACPTPPHTTERLAPREEQPLFLPRSSNDGDDGDSEDGGSVNEPIRRPITRRSRDPRAIYALSSPLWDDGESRGAPPAGRAGVIRSRRTRSVSSTNEFGYDENDPGDQPERSGPEPRRHYPLSPSLAPSTVPPEKTNRPRSVSFAGQLIEESPPISRRKVTTFKSSRKSGAPPPLGERKCRRKSGGKTGGGKAREAKRRREVEHKRTRARQSRVSKFIDDEAVEDNEAQEETEAGSDDHDERLRGTSGDIQVSDGEDTIRTEGMTNRGHAGRSALRRIGEIVVADDDPFAYMAGHLPPLRNRDILPQPYNADNVDASPLGVDPGETEAEEDDRHDNPGGYEQSEEENDLQEEGNEGEEVEWIPGSGFDVTPPTQDPDSARPPEIRGRRRKIRVGREGHVLPSLAARRKHPSRVRGKSKKVGSVPHWMPSDDEEEDEYEAMLQQVALDEEARLRKTVAGGKRRSRKRPWPEPRWAGDQDTGNMREVTKALPLQVDRGERWEWDDTAAHAHEEWQARRGRRPIRRHAQPDEDHEDEEEETGIRKPGELSLSRNDSAAEKQAR